jgi:hypothetical protein
MGKGERKTFNDYFILILLSFGDNAEKRQMNFGSITGKTTTRSPSNKVRERAHEQPRALISLIKEQKGYLTAVLIKHFSSLVFERRKSFKEANAANFSPPTTRRNCNLNEIQAKTGTILLADNKRCVLVNEMSA